MTISTLPRRALHRVLRRRPVHVDALPLRAHDHRVYAGNVQCTGCGSWNTTGDPSSWVCHDCGAMVSSG